MISVIIPIYCVEKYISACISSMINQSDKDFELVLVNDGSPDNSAVIAKELLEKSDLKYKIINTENKGVSSARNTGLRHAHGDYVIYVDSDDYVADSFVGDLKKLAGQNPHSEVLFCNFIILNEEKTIGKETFEWNVQTFDHDTVQCINMDRKIKFLLPTMLLNREYLIKNNILFDEKVRYSEDVQYIWRALAYTDKPVTYLEKTLYYYIFHGNSTMSASGVDKILTGCTGIIDLYNEIETHLCERCRKFMVGSWFFSMLHGAAKMLDFVDFKTLYKKSLSKHYLKTLFASHNAKIIIITICMFMSLRCGYFVMRKF